MSKNNKSSILVIEDEKGIRNFLSYELSRKNYIVDTASDGEEGVEKAKKTKYDIIISDIMMPKMNGLDALKLIKKNSPETEVIMITGYATVENAIQAMKDGAYDFLQKPFNTQELFSLIEKAIEKSELRTLLAIYESSQAVFSTLKLEELLPVMIKLIEKVVHADETALLLFDHQNQIYLAAASFPLNQYAAKEFYLSLMDAVKTANRIQKSSVILNRSDENDAPLFSKIKVASEVDSVAVFPITLKNKKYGVLCVGRRKDTLGFNQADIRNLSVFISQIAQSIANTKLYEQLEIKISELEDTNSQLDEAKEQLTTAKKLVDSKKVSETIMSEMKKTLAVILNHIAVIVKENKISPAAKEHASTIKEVASECQDKVKHLLDSLD